MLFTGCTQQHMLYTYLGILKNIFYLHNEPDVLKISSIHWLKAKLFCIWYCIDLQESFIFSAGGRS